MNFNINVIKLITITAIGFTNIVYTN